MKWFEQFSLVMRCTATTLREKVEDPERMLHQLLIDMQHELDHVRSRVAESIADEIQLQKRVASAKSEIENWHDRAEQAIRQGDDRSAGASLQQKCLAEERYQSFEADYQTQRREVLKLQESVQDLEDKIRRAKHKKTLLVARHARASSTAKITAALDRTGGESALAQFERFEEKVDRQESMELAWQRLDNGNAAPHDADGEALSRKLDRENREREIADELQQLKASLGESEPTS